jgi:hypothetical protein
MFRNVVAVVIGVVTAFVTVMLVDKIGHMVYPAPAGLDLANPDAVRPYLATLPVGAFLFILASSVVAAFDGTLVACLVGTVKPRVFGSVVGGFVFAASVANFIAIPHPLWLALATLAGVILSTLLAMRLATAIRGTETRDSNPG